MNDLRGKTAQVTSERKLFLGRVPETFSWLLCMCGGLKAQLERRALLEWQSLINAPHVFPKGFLTFHLQNKICMLELKWWCRSVNWGRHCFFVSFFFNIPTSFTHSHSSFPTFCCLLLPVLWAPNHFLKAQMERLVTSCFKRCLCQMPPTQNFRLLWQFWVGARLFAPSTLQSGADALGAESKQRISYLEETYTCV